MGTAQSENRDKPQPQEQDPFPPILVRNNYGILLERYKTIDNSATIWSHTFALPFPKKIHVDKSIRLCNVKDHSDLTLPENLKIGRASCRERV